MLRLLISKHTDYWSRARAFCGVSHPAAPCERRVWRSKRRWNRIQGVLLSAARSVHWYERLKRLMVGGGAMQHSSVTSFSGTSGLNRRIVSITNGEGLSRTFLTLIIRDTRAEKGCVHFTSVYLNSAVFPPLVHPPSSKRTNCLRTSSSPD